MRPHSPTPSTWQPEGPSKTTNGMLPPFRNPLTASHHELSKEYLPSVQALPASRPAPLGGARTAPHCPPCLSSVVPSARSTLATASGPPSASSSKTPAFPTTPPAPSPSGGSPLTLSPPPVPTVRGFIVCLSPLKVCAPHRPTRRRSCPFSEFVCPWRLAGDTVRLRALLLMLALILLSQAAVTLRAGGTGKPVGSR